MLENVIYKSNRQNLDYHSLRHLYPYLCLMLYQTSQDHDLLASIFELFEYRFEYWHILLNSKI
ncbi:MAG: hypothetical protein EBV10_12255 [Synechococcaceae bacterium WB6_1A_059]|nr:hypothetical protein [Synechococcaceae bacterium WB6_1A_059]